MIPRTVLRITVDLDNDTYNPTTCDSSWTIYSFGLRLITDTNRERMEEDEEVFEKIRTGLAFLLDYESYTTEFGIRKATCWPEAGIDGLMVWEEPPEELGYVSYEDRRKSAEISLEEYNDWANGRCFCYRVEVATSFAPEYDFEEDPENGAFFSDVDACGGLIGEEYTAESIQKIVDGYPGAKLVVRGEADFIIDYHPLKVREREIP